MARYLTGNTKECRRHCTDIGKKSQMMHSIYAHVKPHESYLPRWIKVQTPLAPAGKRFHAMPTAVLEHNSFFHRVGNAHLPNDDRSPRLLVSRRKRMTRICMKQAPISQADLKTRYIFDIRSLGCARCTAAHGSSPMNFQGLKWLGEV